MGGVGDGGGPTLGIGVGKGNTDGGLTMVVTPPEAGEAGNTDGGLAMADSPPEAGEAGEDEVGDSTICNLFCPLSL